jgi:hypothetical protein
MDNEKIDPAAPAKRGRFEIKFIVAFVTAVIILGGGWVALHGSPNRARASIDSSSNPTPTITAPPAAQPRSGR